MRSAAIKFLVLLVLLPLSIGCREEVVEELESYGVKREWIPFAGGFAPGQVDPNYHQRYVDNAFPWFYTQIVESPYQLSHDKLARSGKRALKISNNSDPSATLTLSRNENVEDLLGNKIRFSAYLRPEGWKGKVALREGKGNDEDFALTGVPVGELQEGKWTKVSIEMDVSQEAEYLIPTLQFEGKGTIYIDDCAFEKISISTWGPALRNVKVEHRNLGFEEDDREVPQYAQPVDSLSYRMPTWQADYFADEYKLILDSTMPHSGKYCGGFRSVSTKGLNGAVFYISVPPEHIEAHRAKFSIWIKPEGLEGIVSIGGVANGEDFSERKSRRLWEINGTASWKQYSMELEIPQHTKYAWMWIGYTGQGTLLVDDLSYERVSRLPDTENFVDKSTYFAKPINMDFESQ